MCVFWKNYCQKSNLPLLGVTLVPSHNRLFFAPSSLCMCVSHLIFSLLFRSPLLFPRTNTCNVVVGPSWTLRSPSDGSSKHSSFALCQLCTRFLFRLSSENRTHSQILNRAFLALLVEVVVVVAAIIVVDREKRDGGSGLERGFRRMTHWDRGGSLCFEETK